MRRLLLLWSWVSPSAVSLTRDRVSFRAAPPGSDADICERCWQYMNVAVKVMDTGLRGTSCGPAACHAPH